MRMDPSTRVLYNFYKVMAGDTGRVRLENQVLAKMPQNALKEWCPKEISADLAEIQQCKLYKYTKVEHQSRVNIPHGMVKAIASGRAPVFEGVDADDKFLHTIIDRLHFFLTVAVDHRVSGKSPVPSLYGKTAATKLWLEEDARVTKNQPHDMVLCRRLNQFAWLLTPSQAQAHHQWMIDVYKKQVPVVRAHLAVVVAHRRAARPNAKRRRRPRLT